MRKLLASTLMVVGVVSAVTLATRAFFSDTETSNANTFQAGAIDLQVDSQAHYNGMDCVNEQWSDCTPADGNLLQNGSFESPEVTASQKWQTFANGTGGMAWTVEWVEGQAEEFNSVDRPNPALQEYQEGVNGWLAHDGDQFTELDSDWFGPTGPNSNISGEPALVKIYQDIVTTPGTLYQLKYYFSARPQTAADENVLIVKIGADSDTHTFGNATNQTNWIEYTKNFIAVSNSTRIEFQAGGTANSLGVLLDDVTLTAMNCVPNPNYSNQTCDGTWTLTDLGPENQFFTFQDIKPGDQGENTISLHLEDNDAYACLYFNDVSDNENSLVEPEVEFGDDTENVGEIAKYLNFFAWYDDGDNVWESGETPLLAFDSGAISAETWLAGGASYDLYSPASGDSPFIAGSTRFLGLAWCAGNLAVNYEAYTLNCDGSTMLNDAQTDQLQASIGFYVEQARNNENFTCRREFPTAGPSVTPGVTPDF